MADTQPVDKNGKPLKGGALAAWQRKNGGTQTQESASQSGQQSQPGTQRGHAHHWRLLKSTRRDEAHAIARGYTRICDECDDVE